MSKKPAAIPIFGDAYLADTMHLSLEEHGAYFLLMLAAWRSSDCALPDDDVKLARICRCTPRRFKVIKSTIFGMWDLTDDGWTQKRLSKEFAYVEDKRRSQAQKADARWGKDEDDDHHPRDGARLRAERLSGARKRGRHTKEQWEALLETISHQCVRCTATGVELVRDHIKPIYQGGSDAISNIQPLCNKCNSSKGNNSTDFRLTVCKDLFERLPECLPDTPISPAPPPSPIAASEPKGSSAAAREIDFVDLANRIATASGLPLPDPMRNWNRHNEHIELVKEWIEAGADPDMILKTIKERVAAARTLPKSWRYFDAAVLESAAARAAGQSKMDADTSSLVDLILERKKREASG